MKIKTDFVKEIRRDGAWLLALLLASVSAQAGTWSLGTTLEDDNYDDYRGKASLEYAFPCSEAVYCFADAWGSRYGSSALGGIPGGSLSAAGLEFKLQTVVGRFLLKGGAGWTELPRLESWAAGGEVKAGVPGLPGVTGRLEAHSRWIEGSWLGYSVRSSQATVALALERWRTYAEAGALVDFRNGGRDPGASLPLQLPGNRLSTVYAWASRSWTGWLMAGLSGRYTNATADVHQATMMRNDSAVWSDFPYASVPEESAIEALLTLKTRKFTLTADCPIHSATRQKSDEQYPGGSSYWYWTSLTAPANVSLKFEAPVSDWIVEATLRASSRPYSPHAWFTDNAWNQVGFDLTLRH